MATENRFQLPQPRLVLPGLALGFRLSIRSHGEIGSPRSFDNPMAICSRTKSVGFAPALV